jgi:hypothetical protein
MVVRECTVSSGRRQPSFKVILLYRRHFDLDPSYANQSFTRTGKFCEILIKIKYQICMIKNIDVLTVYVFRYRDLISIQEL